MKKIAIVVIFLLLTLTVGCIETEIKKGEDEIYPTFTIESYDFYYIKSQKTFKYPATVWSNSNIVRNADGTPWDDPTLTFSIKLIPKAGAQSTDFESIYFSVENLDKRIAGEYRLIAKTGGWYRAIWRCGSNIWYERGTQVIFPLKTHEFTLNLTVNQIGLSFLEEFDEVSLDIVFHNVDNSWEEKFAVTFIVIEEAER